VADPRLTQPVFYYDLADPWSYLAGERVMATLPQAPEWEPVRMPSAVAAVDRGAVELAAAEMVLQPLRWPTEWPPDSDMAMLAATYAKQVGRAVAFSLAAFRQAFAGGRDLGEQDTVLIAGAACEMHPAALLKAVSLRSVREALDAAGGRAYAAGVLSVPAIEAQGRVFTGAGCVEQAAQAMAA
jgi:2-hydroxychromene-2-carboxylate isomerase